VSLLVQMRLTFPAYAPESGDLSSWLVSPPLRNRLAQRQGVCPHAK
jgi:hypothetical protein